MELVITFNVVEQAALLGVTKTMIRNLGEGVPTAILTMMKTAGKTAQSLTHQGATKRLQAGWKVEQQKFNFSLYNVMPYASEEFNRPGEKIAGNPPHGPHNIIPNLIDMISGNIENIIGKAIFANVTR
jgi:hypothetical protein